MFFPLFDKNPLLLIFYIAFTYRRKIPFLSFSSFTLFTFCLLYLRLLILSLLFDLSFHSYSFSSFSIAYPFYIFGTILAINTLYIYFFVNKFYLYLSLSLLTVTRKSPVVIVGNQLLKVFSHEILLFPIPLCPITLPCKNPRQ